MSRRPVVASVLQSASIAAALALCPAVYASSVQTVFSAENALYGAGYAVGQADGWIDDSLRAAIRQYQTDHPELASTGALDSSTLAALGVSAKSSQLLGGNSVATRSDAMATLGLTDKRSESAPENTVVAAPEQKPVAPETKPEPEVAKKPEPESKPVEIVASAPPTADPAPKAEPAEPAKTTQIVVEAKPEPKPEPVETKKPAAESSVASVEAVQQEALPESESEPEPDSQPVQVTSSFGPGENSQNGRVLEQSEFPVEDNSDIVAGNSDTVEPAQPQESVAAEVAASQTEPKSDSANAKSQRNVLTMVFDFLFGWMV